MQYVPLFAVHILTFNLFLTVNSQNGADDISDRQIIENIANGLIITLGVNLNPNDTRFNELKQKLNKINSYALDKDKFALLLTNVTKETNLSETSFFKSLNEDDQFKFLTNTEPKNLYLKMKERMNRDDVFKILTERGNNSGLVKTARKVVDFDYFGNDEEVLDTIVDKLIAETPSDNHKFDDKKLSSMYWDPQKELEDLKEHHNHDGRRIFRGERATVKDYPYMVSVHVMGRFWCGGVIYYHDLVITSAACLQLMHNNRFFRENPRVLQVRVGSNHSRIGGELIDALEVYFHPGYNPRNLRNNLAVIRLRRTIIFNYHRVPKTIRISTSPYTVPATAEVLLLGWGVTKVTQKMSYEPVYLQKKFLPVYPNNFCKEVYGDKFITQTMFCAGTFTTGEGACDHDAGGPAVLAGRLVGVISFGPAVCGYPNAPTVFTLVGAFSDWLETVNETMPSYYRGRGKTTTTTRKPIFDYLLKKYTPDALPPHQLDEIDLEPMVMVEQLEPTPEPTVVVTETTEPSPGFRFKNQKLSEEDSWGD